MSIRIVKNRNEGWPWQSRDGIHAKGYLFDHADTYIRGNGLLDYFSGIGDSKHFMHSLQEANGAFSVIVETGEYLFAAVDPVRSIPLFYAIGDNQLVLGDDAQAIQNELGGKEIDLIAKEEFLRFGYTVGPSTLDTRIKQIMAGEIFVYDKLSMQERTRIYFSHAHGDYTDKNEDQLVDELDQITNRWAQRLVNSAQGRTIVVPLSGGYDSRYIACALKRAGYQNVICYSYGVPESYEHQIAGKVAAQLGYPIHIIDYGGQSWKTLIESPRFLEFCRFASHRDAVPCIQELLAREMLLKMKVLPADSIIVPGYCGDLQGGSYVPVAVLNRRSRKVLNEGIDRYLIRTLLALRTSPVSIEVNKAILDHVNTFTSRFNSSEIQDFCSVLEDWFTRHQVAKFVINTVRTHEFFGNEWRLPLWDNELISWWYRIPLRHRIKSTLFHRFLFERIFVPAGVAFTKPNPKGRLNRFAQTWLPDGMIPFVRALYKSTVKRSIDRSTETQVNLDGFDCVSKLLLKELSGDFKADDFSNINGVVATWCIQQYI